MQITTHKDTYSYTRSVSYSEDRVRCSPFDSLCFSHKQYFTEVELIH